MYMMQDPGPMKELAEASLAMLGYFKFGAKSENKTAGRKIILADHYADAAYLGNLSPVKSEHASKATSLFTLSGHSKLKG